MAVGDQIAQNFVERKTAKELNFVRTAQFASIGLFIAVSNFNIIRGIFIYRTCGNTDVSNFNFKVSRVVR